MTRTVSEALIDRLRAWGVARVFGFPGDGIGAFDGALGAAESAGDGLHYVRPTHEEICAFMATAYAKFTGRTGVCVATSSPGGFHLLNGLYDAQMDNQPVVAIVGQQGLASLGTSTQQESNLERVFQDVACYVQTIVSPQQVNAVVDTAFRTAQLRLQPAVIILPHDVQSMPAPPPPRAHWVSRSSPVPASTAITPPADELARAAAILNAGERVTFLVGAGARGATEEVVQAALLCRAGVITSLRGKDVVPSDVPFHTQQLGLLGSLPSMHQAKECDTFVMIGTNYPYGEFLPESDAARGIQIDLKPTQLGVRFPNDVNLWGDVRSTLRALLPLLRQKDDTTWQDRIADDMRDWEDEMNAQADVDYDDGVNPRRLYRELNARLPEGAVVTADAGTTADWYGHHIRLRRGMSGDLSGRLASMLAAMPYAVAAKFAHPDRPVICTIGDGAFQMLGMNELITVRKYRHEWENRQLVIVVLHNDDLGQVSWEMRTEDANPVWRTAQDVESIDYAGYAQLLGFRGIRVRDDADIVPALQMALSDDDVTLIDAMVSRNVPPLPPHITAEYAKHTGLALLKGDPFQRDVIRDSAAAVATAGMERIKNALHLGRDDA